MKTFMITLLFLAALPVIQAGAIKDGDPAPELKGEHWSDGGDYTFTTQSNVLIHVTSTNSSLGCLYVDEKPANHPNAVGQSAGIQTGKYWTIEGLQSDGVTLATGYLLNLTLPHSILIDANAYVCKYPGLLGGAGWDCARNSSTATTVTRETVSSLSDWAVGNNVGPTALTLQTLTARAATTPFALIALAFLGAALFLFIWRKQKTITQQ